jgi:hypothetical protein
MMNRALSFKNYMTADLVNAGVVEFLAERLYERRAANIARQLHAKATTSSRTK